MTGATAEGGTDRYWIASRPMGEFDFVYSDCKGALDPAERARIVADLAEVLPSYGIQQYWDNVPDVFADYDACALMREKSGATVGLIGARWYGADPDRILYIWTGQLAERLQDRGLFAQLFGNFMFATARSYGPPRFVAVKTHSAKVFSMVQRFASLLDPENRFYPTLGGVSQDLDLQKKAVVLAGALCPGRAFDAELGIVREGQRSAPDFFQSRPETRDAVAQEYFQREIGAFDQVLCVLAVSPDAATVRGTDRMKAFLLEHTRVEKGG